MLVIGIDPGTASTGYGVIRQGGDGGLELVAYGVISTPSDQPMAERLRDLHKELCDLLSLHQPDSGAVEKLFFQRNVSTAITVGQARGVLPGETVMQGDQQATEEGVARAGRVDGLDRLRGDEALEDRRGEFIQRPFPIDSAH